MPGQRVRGLRLYRDGSSELDVEPGPRPVEQLWSPPGKIYEEIAALLSTGKRKEARKLAWKAAWRCLANHYYREGSCDDCVVRPVCPLFTEKGRKWFKEKTSEEIRKSLEEWAGTRLQQRQ